MRRRVSFYQLAEDELNDGVQHYERVNPGLGSAFLDAAERAIQEILEFPESSPEIENHVRRRLTRQFPYAVLYRVRADEVRILAIMNLRRRPFYWYGRD